MRIAFFVTAFPELSITFIVNQITFLLDGGHQVDIIALRPGQSDSIHQDVVDYRLVEKTRYVATTPAGRLRRMLGAAGLLARYGLRYPGPCLRALNPVRFGSHAVSLELLFQTTSLLPPRKYDVIHCHFGPAGRIASDLRDIGALRGRIITTYHGYGVTTYPRRHGPDVYKRLFDRGELFTVNSAFTLGKLAELGCPASRIVKLPVGLNLQRFTFSQRRLQVGDSINILTVARLVEVKGVEYGIRALARLAENYPLARYQIAGDGPLRPELEKLSRDLGLEDRVEFLGPLTQEQLQPVYDQAHIFILPGVVAADGAEEGQGLVLLEAQATGLPVIASRIGGVPDSLLDGESGFLVEPGNVLALADKLAWLMDHPQGWAQMGIKGRVHVEREFDIVKLNNRLIELYEQIQRGPR